MVFRTEITRWLVFMIINFADIFSFYLISHGLLDKKVPWKFSYRKHLFWGLLYGVVLGTISYYIGEVEFFQLIILPFPFLMFYKLYSKEYRLKVYHVFSMFVLAIVVFMILHAVIVFSLTRLEMSRIMLLILVAFLMPTTSRVVIIFPWLNKIYNRLKSDLFMQFIVIIIAYSSIMFASILWISTLIPLVFISLIIAGIIAFVIGHLISKLYYYTEDMPKFFHDRTNELLAIQVELHQVETLEEARRIFDDFLIDSARIKRHKQAYQQGHTEENIYAFINNKLEQKESPMRWDTQVQYRESHENVPFNEMLTMVGLLIDNAIESGRPKYLATLKIYCFEDVLFIRQTNATLERMNKKQIKKMLKKGNSTKSHDGRGYGLTSLRERIKYYGGQFTIESFYNEHEHSYYLEFMIEVVVKSK